MKKIFKNIVSLAVLAVIGGGMFSSCSDEHMIEVNTDDTKTPNVNPNNLLTTGMLQTYGDFDMMDTYRCYITGFAQYYSGGWNVATYAGQNMQNNEYSRKMWDKLYGVALKNIVQGIHDSADKPNVNSAMRIYRVYLLSMIVDTYGDAPCKEAGLASISGVRYPKYDTQEEAYKFFFEELKDAVSKFKDGGDKISGDVSTMGGSITQWKKFANSLRMRFAMRISEVDPEWAQKEFEEAYKTNLYISKPADNVMVKYLKKSFTFYKGAEELDFRMNALAEMLYGQDPTSPTFICKTLYKYMESKNDPRLSRIARCYLNPTRIETGAEGYYDMTDDIIAWGKEKRESDPSSKAGIQPNEVGEAWYNAWPTIPEPKEIPEFERLVNENPIFNESNFPARMTRPFLNIAFNQADCPGVVFTSAETLFLLAEAAHNGWKVDKEAEDYYKSGVQESMEFLNSNYSIKAITDGEIKDYINANPIGSNPKESINLQAWILHMTNPVEGWANQRRSNYPLLRDRRDVPNEANMSLGEDFNKMTVPCRLKYPMLEEENNAANYKEATARQKDADGQYSWHARVWWDVKDTEYFEKDAPWYNQ